jgi:hypothetical protein
MFHEESFVKQVYFFDKEWKSLSRRAKWYVYICICVYRCIGECAYSDYKKKKDVKCIEYKQVW